MPTTLDPKIVRQEWIKDLTSGEFTQRKGQLASTDDVKNCCCLGVLCHTVNRLLPEDEQVSWHPEDSVPPATITQAAGLSTTGGGYNHSTDSLADDNDARDHSFATIAKTLKSKPKGLFNA